MPIAISILPDVQELVAPAALAFAEVTVVEHDHRLDAPFAEAESRLRTAGASLDAAVALTRALYRGFGVDPTKTRPSSEALLRRVRRGEPLPRVNSLVDVCNWCSVETQIPFGLYDLDRIEGERLVLRLGAEGEGYDGIRKDRVNVGGRLTIADAQGPFGNPTSDSARTMVTAATRRALFVLYVPRAVSPSAREAAVALTRERALAYGGGHEIPCTCP